MIRICRKATGTASSVQTGLGDAAATLSGMGGKQSDRAERAALSAATKGSCRQDVACSPTSRSSL